MDKSAAVYPLAVHVLPYGQDKYPSPVGGFEGIKGTLCNMKVDITPPLPLTTELSIQCM